MQLNVVQLQTMKTLANKKKIKSCAYTLRNKAKRHGLTEKLLKHFQQLKKPNSNLPIKVCQVNTETPSKPHLNTPS